MGFLDLPGLQYFYNKYIKGLKSHAFRDPANNLTTTASGYALDARQGKALNDKVTQLNSALESVESGYLKRYGYTMGASENSINFILPASISGWAYLTFLVVIANNIAAINVIGGEVESSLSSNGITLSIIVGSNITAESIKESGKIRVKCRTSQVSAPVSIIPLRKGVTIESAYTSYTP